MTNPNLSLLAAYRQKWSTDLHPPLFYFLVWALRHLVNNTYASARLVNILPFLIFAASFLLWIRHRGLNPWIATFLTVMASSPFFLANSVDLRSYYFLTILGACLIMTLRIGRYLAEEAILKNKTFIFFIFSIILISLNLHYSASMLYLIAITVEMLIALFARKFKWALLLGAMTCAAGVILLAGLLVTLKTVPNFSYLHTGPTKAIAFIIAGTALSTVANFGIDLAILAAFFKGGFGRTAIWAWSLATLCFAILALFLQSRLNGAMSLKYVLDLMPLGAAFMADLVADQIFSSTLLIVLMALSAVTTQAITAGHEYGNKRWMLYADTLRQIKAACPTAQFVGVDQNALPEFANHPLVSGWIGVFPEGYAEVGQSSGVNFRVTAADRSTNIVLTGCPLALLSDHEVTPTRLSLPDLLHKANISVSHYRRLVSYQHDYQRLFVFYP